MTAIGRSLVASTVCPILDVPAVTFGRHVILLCRPRSYQSITSKSRSGATQASLRLSGATAYAAAMPRLDIVRTLLEQAPGEAVCTACLAFACSTSLSEMLALTAELAADKQFASGARTCVSCHRTTTTIVYSERKKCVHCSREVNDDAVGIDVEGDLFHRSCWQLLVSDARIRLSRSLSRRSRELIADARKRMQA